MEIQKYKVKSKSRPGEFHIVEVLPDGKVVCDCEAAGFKRPCRHKKIIENYLKKNNIMNTQEIIELKRKLEMAKIDTANLLICPEVPMLGIEKRYVIEEVEGMKVAKLISPSED